MTDIEDLISQSSNSNLNSKTPRKPKRSQSEICELGDGGKDFKVRPRIPFWAPDVKWYALGVISIATLSFVAVNKVIRR